MPKKILTPKQQQLADGIRRLRDRLRMSAYDFGELVGLRGRHRHITVYRWENGMITPSGPTMRRIDELADKHRRQSIMIDRELNKVLKEIDENLGQDPRILAEINAKDSPDKPA